MFHQSEGRFKNRRGQSLFTVTLRPESHAVTSSSSSSSKQPVNILLFHHGLTDYSKRHLEPLTSLATMVGHGTVICAYDCIGHGYSEGEKSYIRDINYLVDDLLDYIKHFLPTQFPGSILRIFAMGHSMGGATVAIAASREPRLFHAIILSSPVVQFLPDTLGSKIQTLVLRFLSLFIGRVRVVKRKPVALGTRDEKAVQKLLEDKVWDRGAHRLGTISSLLQACGLMQGEVVESLSGGRAADLPLYIQQGTCDAATEHLYLLAFVAKIVSRSARKRVTLNLVEGAFHDLDFDPESQNCQKKISEWIKKRG